MVNIGQFMLLKKDIQFTRGVRFLLCLMMFVASIPAFASEDSNYKSFYTLITSLQAHPLESRISQLAHFLQARPSFEAAYLTLLEWQIYHGKTDEAHRYFEEKSQSKNYQANALWMLAKIAYLKNDYKAAFSKYRQAFQAGKRSWLFLKEFIEFDCNTSTQFNGEKIIENGRLSAESRKIITAFYHYFRLNDLKAIHIFEQLSDTIRHDFAILGVWGYCYYYSSQPAKADSIWQLGCQLASQKGDLKASALFLSNRGLIAAEVDKNFDQALAYYDSIETTANRISDYHRLQMVAGYRGFFYRERGHFIEAASHFSTAIRIAKRLRAYRFLWDWYRGLSVIQSFLGNYAASLAILDSSEMLTKKFNNIDLQILTLDDKANILIQLKQLSLAKAALKKAENLAYHGQLKGHEARAIDKLGQVFVLEGKYYQARQLFEKYLKMTENDPVNRKNVYRGIGELAYLYFLEEKWQVAREMFQKAAKTAKAAKANSYLGQYIFYLGEIEKELGNADSALIKYHAALKIAEKDSISDLLWKVYQGMGQAHLQNGHLQKAIAAFLKAAKVIEKTRSDLTVDQLRIGYFIESHAIYENLVSAYLKQYEESKDRANLDSIFYYMEMGRGRALQDLRHQGNISTPDTAYRMAIGEVRRLQRELRLQSGTSPPSAIADSVESALQIARLSLLAQQLRPHQQINNAAKEETIKQPDLFTVNEKLQQTGTGILMYHISRQASFAFFSDGHKTDLLPLQLNPDSLKKDIDALLTPFDSFDNATIDELVFKADIAFRLYQSLFAPIAARFQLPEALLIISDGALKNLPFEMLLTARPEKASYTAFDQPVYAPHFLVNRHAIAYSPSTSLLLSKENARPAANPQMLIVANPRYQEAQPLVFNDLQTRQKDNWYFSPLPFTEREAKEIKRTYAHATIRQQDQATKRNLTELIPKYPVIHFSTHGFADTTFDAFSGLALSLSKDTTDDGLLMGYEILDLPFNCDLVTLSACETGRGRLAAGEGILSLPRLLIGAGAKSVLMTRWKVEDKFTAEWMPVFYKHYLEKNQSKIRALATAKRNILKEKPAEKGPYYQHPLFWAAFSLYGDPGYTEQSRWAFFLKILLILLILSAGILWYRRYFLRKAVTVDQ